MTAADDLHETTHARRVMERLQAAIRAAGGWLPFDEYMALVSRLAAAAPRAAQGKAP